MANEREVKQFIRDWFKGEFGVVPSDDEFERYFRVWKTDMLDKALNKRNSNEY